MRSGDRVAGVVPAAGPSSPAAPIHRAGLIQLAVAVILLGAAWPLTRMAVLDGAGPAWFALGRAGFSGLAALVFVAAIGRLRWPVRRDGPALLALGVLQLAAFFALSHTAVAWVGAGRTAVLANAVLVPAVPLSVLLLHEAVSPRRWVACGLGLAGVIVLCGPWSIDWGAPRVLAGHALLLGAATAWAAAIIIVRRWPPQMSLLALMPWAFAIATLALLPGALSHPAGVWTAGSWAALLAIGLIAGPAGSWCVMQAQQTLPVAIAGTGFLLTPALGLVLSAWLLHETLGWDMLLGAGLILGGAAVAAHPGFGSGSRRPGPKEPGPKEPSVKGKV